MRAPAVGLALALTLAWALAPAPAVAQGATVETLSDLPGVPGPPGFRGSLPAQVDLAAGVPPPRDQGATATCVSWSVTYAAGSQAVRRHQPGADTVLSPSSTYNHVAADPFCQRTTRISVTLDFLRQSGALPLQAFAYDPGWCGRLMNEAERGRAQNYRIGGWSAFDAGDIEAVKQQLARGAPVIFAMAFGERLRALRGDEPFDADSPARGGHAMVAVGYDDARQAFRVQSSWGPGWGSGGYAWFAYGFWQRKVSVGFVID